MSANQLNEKQWQELCQNGVLHVPGVFSAQEMQAFHVVINRFYESHPYGTDVATGSPLPALRDDCISVFHQMPLYDSVFETILDKPILENTLERMLGKQYYLNDISMRRVQPGSSRMPYHRDNHGGFCCAILTDDIGPDEGATTIVKRSHLGLAAPQYCLENTRTAEPDEIQAIGKAGDVYFFSQYCWHARSENRSDRWTGIMLPDFVNRSTQITPSIPRVATETQMKMLGDKLRHAIRPFDDTTANKPRGWLSRWVYKYNMTENFFHNLIYFLYTYRGRFKTATVDELPRNLTAMALNQTIPIRRCFENIKLKLFIRRYIISRTLSRFAFGRYIKALITR